MVIKGCFCLQVSIRFRTIGKSAIERGFSSFLSYLDQYLLKDAHENEVDKTAFILGNLSATL